MHAREEGEQSSSEAEFGGVVEVVGEWETWLCSLGAAASLFCGRNCILPRGCKAPRNEKENATPHHHSELLSQWY